MHLVYKRLTNAFSLHLIVLVLFGLRSKEIPYDDYRYPDEWAEIHYGFDVYQNCLSRHRRLAEEVYEHEVKCGGDKGKPDHSDGEHFRYEYHSVPRQIRT